MTTGVPTVLKLVPVELRNGGIEEAWAYAHPDGTYATPGEIEAYIDTLIENGYQNALEDVNFNVHRRVAHY